MAQYPTQQQTAFALHASPGPFDVQSNYNPHSYYNRAPYNIADDGIVDGNMTARHIPSVIYHSESLNGLRQKRYNEVSEWIWEFLAWALGAVVITGIIVILIKFDGRLVETWPISIQVSTVVAFLAQVAQSALL